MNAKKKSPKFGVTEVKNSNLVSNTVLQQTITNRKDTEEACFNWIVIGWLRIVRGSPFMLQFKETLDEDQLFRKVNLVDWLVDFLTADYLL